MAGFRNSGSIDVIYGDNVDFSGAAIPTPQVLSDGQLLIGSSVAPNIRVATLTAGANITITNGNGTIQISASGGGGGGIVWSNVTGTTQSMSANNAYIANNASQVVFTLPASGTIGDIVQVVGSGAGGWSIHQNAGQAINLGNATTTAGTGGSLTSSNQYDAIQLVCTTTNTRWTCTGVIEGNLTVV